MTSGKAKPNYLVKFAAAPADQELLQAVEQALAGSATNFSDLCKQALRLLLTSAEASAHLPMLALLEQQIMTLQLQVMHLEQRSLNATDEDLRLQVQQLTERVNQLEQQAAVEQSEAESEPLAADLPDDPLLFRLAPLLEDF